MGKLKFYIPSGVIPNDKALEAKELDASGCRLSKKLSEFLGFVNDYLRWRFLKNKCYDVDEYLYFNYVEPSEHNEYLDECEGRKPIDKMSRESIIFILDMLRRWDPSKGASFATFLTGCINTYISESQLAKTKPLNEVEMAEFNEWQKKYNPYYDESKGGYARELKQVAVSKDKFESVAQVEPDDPEEVLYDSSLAKLLSRMWDDFEKAFNKYDKRIIVGKAILIFVDYGHLPDSLVDEYNSSKFYDLKLFDDVRDFIEGYIGSELPRVKYLAKYFGKAESHISRVLNPKKIRMRSEK